MRWRQECTPARISDRTAPHAVGSGPRHWAEMVLVCALQAWLHRATESSGETLCNLIRGRENRIVADCLAHSDILRVAYYPHDVDLLRIGVRVARPAEH